ncbi:hypothetical protein SIPHO039v1_p0070 [Vibrio phage 70E35.5a]|nr:hypothetical protein SIPHO039v1_p0070 [Vibrio phage 70E35.5a]
MTFTGIMVAWCLLTPGVPEEAECMSSRYDKVKVEAGLSRADTCEIVFDSFKEGYKNTPALHKDNYKVSCGSKTIFITNEDS